MPAGLSINSTPPNAESWACMGHGDLQYCCSQRFAHGCEHLALDLVWFARKARASSFAMTATAEVTGDGIHVDLLVFRAQADTHLAWLGQFFKEQRDNHAFNLASIVNQPFRVLALGAGFLKHFDGDPRVGNALLVGQLELRERLLEQHQS